MRAADEDAVIRVVNLISCSRRSQMIDAIMYRSPKINQQMALAYAMMPRVRRRQTG